LSFRTSARVAAKTIFHAFDASANAKKWNAATNGNSLAKANPIEKKRKENSSAKFRTALLEV